METVTFYRDPSAPKVMLEAASDGLIVRNGKQGKPIRIECTGDQTAVAALAFFKGYIYAHS